MRSFLSNIMPTATQTGLNELIIKFVVSNITGPTEISKI
jgi:hypothetical protein